MKGLILTYLITATAAIGALRYPLIGLYVYVCFAVLRPQFIWGWAGDLSSMSLIVGVAMLIGWALNGFGSWSLGRGRLVVASLVAFAGWYVLAALQAVNTEVAFSGVLAFAKILLPVLVGVTLLDSESRLRTMLWTIVLAQGYVGLENNLNYLHGNNSAVDGFGGADNNSFAVSLVSVLGPAIALMLSSKTWYARCLAAIAAALILHTTLLTFSRGAMLGLIAMAVTAFVMMPKRPKYLGALLVTVLLAIRLVGPQLAERYSSTFAAPEARDESSESRLDLWLDCLKVVEAQPMFGVGPWNWSGVAARFGWPEGKSAHSVWMETAAETGVPGVVFLMLFFGCAAVKLWPIARTRQTEENRYQVGIAAGVVLSIVGFAVSGQFVSMPNLEVAYYLTMVGVVLLKNVKRETPATVGESHARPQIARAHLANPLVGAAVIQIPRIYPSAPGPRSLTNSPALRQVNSTTSENVVEVTDGSRPRGLKPRRTPPPRI